MWTVWSFMGSQCEVSSKIYERKQKLSFWKKNQSCETALIMDNNFFLGFQCTSLVNSISIIYIMHIKVYKNHLYNTYKNPESNV